MASHTAKNIKPSSPHTLPQNLLADDAARVAISEDGDIIFSSQAFRDIAQIKKKKALSVFHFTELEKKGVLKSVKEIPSGLHKVRLSGNAEILQFQFDWLTTPTKKRFLIASQIEEDLTAAYKALQSELADLKTQLRRAESIGRMGRWEWIVGEKTMIWSDEVYNIFGVSPAEFKPSLASLNERVHRQDSDRVMQAFQRSVIAGNDYDMEFCIMRPDGDIRYIRCEGRCQRSSDGDVRAMFGIMQDMTERVLYERELKEAKDSAERAYAAKTQFLANMSHELRTPLNAIIGFSEMMDQQLLGPIENEKYVEYIKTIRESGQHLLSLISDILDMSKIEAGKYTLDLEDLPVEKTLHLVLQMMEARAGEENVEIVMDDLNCKDLTIVADRRAFMQIFLNLLSNAVKFSKETGGRIEIECRKREDFVSFRVSDNGIGIPANKLHSITRPFEQVSSHYTRNHDGSGLGLAITKELVELHGGTLLIDSTEGVGTTVTVRMPYDAHKTAARSN